MSNLRFLLIALIVFLPSASLADELRPSLLKLNQISSGEWKALFKQPQVRGRFLNLGVKSNCDRVDLSQKVGDTALISIFTLKCAEPLDYIEIDGLARTMVDTMVSISFEDGRVANHLLSGREPVLSFESTDSSLPAYLIYGIEHLLMGFDHVFFVLVLLYIVKGWIKLAKVITSFTVAHSITLGLSAFDVLRLPQPPIEALIAFSIVVLAGESLKPKKGPITSYPWLVTFMFGLLHGLGFAGALADIGLPSSGATMALLLFNIGIEIGQLFIVTIALGISFLVRDLLSRVDTRISYLPVYIMGSLAAMWFFDRGFQLVLPS